MKPHAHVPTRTCMGCGTRLPQPQLLRITARSDGQLEIVHRAPQHGRSGYLHQDESCWKAFAARKGPVRSLRRNVDKILRLRFVEALKQQSSGNAR